MRYTQLILLMCYYFYSLLIHSDNLFLIRSISKGSCLKEIMRIFKKLKSQKKWI